MPTVSIDQRRDFVEFWGVFGEMQDSLAAAFVTRLLLWRQTHSFNVGSHLKSKRWFERLHGVTRSPSQRSSSSFWKWSCGRRLAPECIDRSRKELLVTRVSASDWTQPIGYF
jgi:hypothetical protein